MASSSRGPELAQGGVLGRLEARPGLPEQIQRRRAAHVVAVAAGERGLCALGGVAQRIEVAEPAHLGHDPGVLPRLRVDRVDLVEREPQAVRLLREFAGLLGAFE